MRRSESGHGSPELFQYLVLLALVAGPPILGAGAWVFFTVRAQHPWWVVVLAGIGGAVAGYAAAWGVDLLIVAAKAVIS